jgi:hypothetical protein
MKKAVASLSLDLDNKWSYMKTHGDAGWNAFPSYLNVLVPRVLDFLRRKNLQITFFVVGRDAEIKQNQAALRQISAAGHEIGNHSFNHEPWLHLYTEQEIETELSRAENAIEAATGFRPKGFRGPGFSLSPTVLQILAQRGYEYDCSTFPTYVAPLARAYYFATSKNLSREERERRKQLFGRFKDGFQSLKPYCWKLATGNLIEIPVTTFPVFKTPIHASYLLYLSSFSSLAAEVYWNAALRFCKLNKIEPSILLHPLDFLSAEDAPELRFFPAMNLSLESKLAMMSKIVDALAKKFQIVTTGEHAQKISRSRKIAVRTSFEKAAVVYE